MADEQVIKLLEEIRDLQKQQLENSKLGLANQQQAIATQKQMVQRSRMILIVVGAVVLAMYLLPGFWWVLGSGMRCLSRR